MLFIKFLYKLELNKKKKIIEMATVLSRNDSYI